ncbi:tetratricopeptide repeat protein [Actinoplanes sp. L3-i22]|uniref:tetratricopeptide repeat protein n=1 Tax=Actinoplanes sp. L3-i22 TaxID=2836373 RepID=UPI001C861396|nr:tetratricopeptide repeat protein [Actinoplanes sp. L3-i22]
METASARLLRRAHATADVDELVDIGCDLADSGQAEGAEYCFRRASELGDGDGAFNLGNTLFGLGRFPEAVAAYQLALDRGVTDAWLNLGMVLHELGDLAGEMRAYQQAERAGDSGGPLMLAFCLRELGEHGAALAAVERASAAGHERAAAVLACWRWDESLDPALEPDLRAGAELYPSARADLGALLVTTGRVEEGRLVFLRGMELGETESMVPLGNLYADVLGDDAAAEAAYRAGAELGDRHAHHNLAVLLERHGDLAGAERHFRQAAAGGDTLAEAALRELLED